MILKSGVPLYPKEIFDLVDSSNRNSMLKFTLLEREILLLSDPWGIVMHDVVQISWNPYDYDTKIGESYHMENMDRMQMVVRAYDVLEKNNIPIQEVYLGTSQEMEKSLTDLSAIIEDYHNLTKMHEDLLTRMKDSIKT
jgi:hypothetical protein